jgi:hypothetical protein
MEEVVDSSPALAAVFSHTGLERTDALRRDMAWISREFAPGTPVPSVGEPGRSYVALLQSIREDVPRFLCHFYNYYFAHTAGGLVIGKKVSCYTSVSLPSLTHSLSLVPPLSLYFIHSDTHTHAHTLTLTHTHTHIHTHTYTHTHTDVKTSAGGSHTPLLSVGRGKQCKQAG